jgi:predicted metalloprotease with PDZ domain
MTISYHRFRNVAVAALTLAALTPRAGAQTAEPITLQVDATEAPRHLIHAHLNIPVSPGPLSLYYPKWIPGEHGPTGPIVNMADLKLTAGGQPVAWQRDGVEMYTLHCTVPEGARALDVDFDFLAPTENQGFTGGASTTSNLAVINWNQLLLYPAGKPASGWSYKASLRLPTGWKHGTALPIENESADLLQFKPVSLERLIDSPVAAGRYLRAIPLTAGPTPHEIDLVADSEAALQMPDSDIAGYKRLVAETGAIFGARHYGHYNFLFTLSDHVASFGLEHHESSDDRVPERTLLDESSRKAAADLLPHEFFHSWNGKYRRPAGLATPDYQAPMKGELLWVYEGLTDYYGNILTARTGLWTPEDYREFLADTAAALDNEPGRTWRPLADTAVEAQILYNAPGEAFSSRRGTDFYPEGDLIWLEADTIIRDRTGGKRSLNDFCRRFHGGQDSAPMVKPYDFDEVVRTLNEVAPYDWGGFLTERLTSTSPHAPLGGIVNGGWKLVYTEAPNSYSKIQEQFGKFTNFFLSLGFGLKEDGGIGDVVAGSPAALAGMGPGIKLVAVNGRKWSADLLRDALHAAKSSKEPIELLAENGEFYRTYRLDYHGGERYAHLVRDETKPDLLSEILKPDVAAAAASTVAAH